MDFKRFCTMLLLHDQNAYLYLKLRSHRIHHHYILLPSISLHHKTLRLNLFDGNLILFYKLPVILEWFYITGCGYSPAVLSVHKMDIRVSLLVLITTGQGILAGKYYHNLK